MGLDLRHLKAGIFIVPKSGLYHFVFRANLSFISKSDPLLSSSLVRLYLNYEVVENTLWTSNHREELNFTKGITTHEGKMAHLKWNSKSPGIKLRDYSFKGYLLKKMI